MIAKSKYLLSVFKQPDNTNYLIFDLNSGNKVYKVSTQELSNLSPRDQNLNQLSRAATNSANV